MLDDFIDRLTSRLMGAAGLVMAAAIAAVSAAMAIFAFLSAWVGSAWAYVIVSATAAAVLAVWSLMQTSERDRERKHKRSAEQHLLETLYAHPSAAFLAGVAAATLLKGKPGEAAAIWKARKTARP